MPSPPATDVFLFVVQTVWRQTGTTDPAMRQLLAEMVVLHFQGNVEAFTQRMLPYLPVMSLEHIVQWNAVVHAVASRAMESLSCFVALRDEALADLANAPAPFGIADAEALLGTQLESSSGVLMSLR